MKQIKKKAQSLTEYTIVAGIIAVVLVAMGTPFRRTIQRVVKDVCDVIGMQADAEQASEDITQGQLINSAFDSTATMTQLKDGSAGVQTAQKLGRTSANSISYSSGGVVDD